MCINLAHLKALPVQIEVAMIIPTQICQFMNGDLSTLKEGQALLVRQLMPPWLMQEVLHSHAQRHLQSDSTACTGH